MPAVTALSPSTATLYQVIFISSDLIFVYIFKLFYLDCIFVFVAFILLGCPFCCLSTQVMQELLIVLVNKLFHMKTASGHHFKIIKMHY